MVKCCSIYVRRQNKDRGQTISLGSVFCKTHSLRPYSPSSNNQITVSKTEIVVGCRRREQPADEAEGFAKQSGGA